jgi:hypothetical protein
MYREELGRAIASPDVWSAVLQAMLVTCVLAVLGIGIARGASLVRRGTGHGASLGVGLGLGLCLVISMWAAVASGGQSAFTPVAITYAIAIGVMLRDRRAPTADGIRLGVVIRTWLPTGLAVIAFLAGAALLYGSSIALQPRDGSQPVEFMDEAFYSVLGRDLNDTGLEWAFSPAGFGELRDTTPQTWYHWGELWLAAGVRRVFGTSAIDARHFVALPIVLLAVACMVGAFVQRFSRSPRRAAFLFGVAACLVLAPFPWLLGPNMPRWEVGYALGITTYGMAAIPVLLLAYRLLLPSRALGWPQPLVVGSTYALLLPVHIVAFGLATLALGCGVVWLVATARWTSVRREVPISMSRTGFVALLVTVATVAWGLLTGHGVGGVATSGGVEPFGEVWRQSILAFIVGAGILFAPLVAAWVLRSKDPIRAAMAGGAVLLVVLGAVVWGVRLAELNMFYVFFAGVAIFLVPVAAASAWFLVVRARAIGRRALSLALVTLFISQLLVGTVAAALRLQGFGPGVYHPVPLSILEVIRGLPADAKVAYACEPTAEISIWTPRLLSIDAHTGRRMIAMCFQADNLGTLIGAPRDPRVMSPFFRNAPQRELYPAADAEPSATAVAAFLAEHGIDYIYQDAVHADTLVPWAVEVVRDGESRLLQVP